MRLILSALLGGCMLGGSPDVQATQPSSRRVCFVDEAVKEPSLVAFRGQVLQAIEARDLTRLRPMIAPDVFLEKGVQGRERLVRERHLTDPKSRSWLELAEILKLGGRFDGSAFCAPYTSCPSPPEFGADGDVIVLGQDVPAYKGPSTSSEVIARLSCDVLTVLGGPRPPRGWWSVRLGDKWGYVQVSKARWIALTYIYMERRDGRWLITRVSTEE